MQQLSLSARPRKLDSLIGQQKIIDAIRGHAASKRTIKGWLFSGPKGAGKTTISRILALSLQCTHQEKFGNPCKECYADRSSFPIHEVNCADKTGIDDIRAILGDSDYGVFSGARYKVYILDEVHALSKQAQDAALKYLEDSPETSVFILCSTMPWMIKETLQSRCVMYPVAELEPDDVLALVERLLKRVGSDLAADRLADALCEKGILFPRGITQAVEKYLAGQDPSDAANVITAATVDTRVLTKAVVRGDWEGVRTALAAAQSQDIRLVRLSVLAYLRTVLLEEPEVGTRSDAVAAAISGLASVQNTEDLAVSASVVAELYRLTKLFSKYKH
jgi:DNA polymerase III subunit gamma/tau